MASSPLELSRYADDIVSNISSVDCLTLSICYLCDVSFVEDVWEWFGCEKVKIYKNMLSWSLDTSRTVDYVV